MTIVASSMARSPTAQSIGSALAGGQSYGPNLLVNGDFSAGTTGWATYGTALAVVDGELQATSTTTNPNANQAVATEIGATYQVDGQIRCVTATVTYVKAQSVAPYIVFPGGSGNVTSTSMVSFSFRFVATTVSTQVFMQLPGVIGVTAAMDNMSIRKVL